jgi:hypothetical protein
VYHLSVVPAAPDFALTLALDRYEATAGGGTAVALAAVTRLNGFTGPVELSIVGDEGIRGQATAPNGQATGLIPLWIDEDAKPGAFRFRVRGKATVDGKEVVRFATATDLVKANLGGMPNPPLELLGGCAVAVVEKPPFTLKLTADPAKVEKGKAGKVLVEATRNGYDADIPLAVLSTPPNVTAAAKPVAKGQTKAEVAVTVAANAAAGPSPLLLRATAKVAGKDYAVTPPPVVVEVIEAKKKEEPKKKDEPKKDKK